MPPFVHRADGQSASRNDVALLNLKIDALTSALEKLATKEAKMSKAVPFDESSVQSETDNENWDVSASNHVDRNLADQRQRLKPLDSRTHVPDWLSYASNPRGRQASHVEEAPTHDRSEAGHSTASGSVYTPETSKTWSESVKTDKPNPAKNRDIITLDIATFTKIISDMHGLSRGSFEQAKGQYPASDKLTIKWQRMGWKTVFEVDVLSSEEPVAGMSKEHAKREIVALCEAYANPDETWNWDGDLEVDRTRFERMLESFVDRHILAGPGEVQSDVSGRNDLLEKVKLYRQAWIMASARARDARSAGENLIKLGGEICSQAAKQYGLKADFMQGCESFEHASNKIEAAFEEFPDETEASISCGVRW